MTQAGVCMCELWRGDDGEKGTQWKVERPDEQQIVYVCTTLEPEVEVMYKESRFHGFGCK